MTTTEFDPDAILDDEGLDENVAEGRKALPPEGVYEITIDNIVASEPDRDEDIESGVKARLLFEVSSEDTDADLNFYARYKGATSHPRSNYAQIMRAVFGEKGEAAGKQPRDLIGRSLKLSIFHVDDPRLGRYAERKFTRAG